MAGPGDEPREVLDVLLPASLPEQVEDDGPVEDTADQVVGHFLPGRLRDHHPELLPLEGPALVHDARENGVGIFGQDGGGAPRNALDIASISEAG